MSHLLPCPGCNRHVLNTEESCPFCSVPLDLGDRPAPPLPRGRLGRAAQFAFGATVVGATALLNCSGETDEKPGSGGSAGANTGGSAGTNTGGNTNSGGTDSAGGASGSSSAGSSNAGTAGTLPEDGGAQPLYGGAPIYGAAP